MPNKVLGALPRGVEAKTLPALLQGKEAVSDDVVFYVCEEGRCHQPAHSVEEVIKLLRES